MIFPIGHEHTTVRRLPWVTFSIMGLCVLAFLFSLFVGGGSGAAADEQLVEALEYFFEHPYLEMPERLYKLLEREYGEEQLEAEIEGLREMGPDPPESASLLEEEQAVLDEMVGGIYDALDRSPLWRWGLIPADFHVASVITYQFLHGGWLHLLGNLFLLYLVGPFIEDVWGRPLYATFYLVAGAVAGLMYMVRYPDFDGPLIGASGAVAGVMGAFLVRYWSTKIKFIYWFAFFIHGTFDAPAWLMLPLWFFKELAYASLADWLVPGGGGGGGVAFWAHVWGFAFGVGVAFLISQFQVEERFVHANIESKLTVVDNTAVESAVSLADTGDARGAAAALEKELAADPDNVDAAMALWSLCLKQGDPAPAVPHMMRAMRGAVRRNDDVFVIAHWEDMLRACGTLPVDPALGVRIAEILEKDRRDDSARDTLVMANARISPSTPVALRLRMARLAVLLASPIAGEIIDGALAHPELSPEERSELETARAGLAPPAEAVPDESEEEVAPSHSLQVVSAVPKGLDGNSLQVEVNGQLRSLGLEAIQALAVAGISRFAEKPIVLVDLLLDSPWGDREVVRTVRLLSNSFDPRSLVGGDEALPAFQKLLDRILEISEAVPLPDPDAARGKPFQSFATIDAYQTEVLNITG